MSLYARSHRRAPSLTGCTCRRTSQWRFIGTSPITPWIGTYAAPLPHPLAQPQSSSPPSQDQPPAPGQAEFVICDQTIEEPFGWAKTVGGMAQTVYRGVERVRARFTLTMAACNLARLPRLLAA
jgi:hypothetical protein